MMLGILGALVVGLSLGLLGSGGSILTVPVLIYLLGQEEKVAIAGSLAIVGGIALVGAIDAARQGRIVWRSALLFGLPGMAGTWGGAWLAGWVSGAFQLTVFAIVMLLAAVLMLGPPRQPDADRGPVPLRRAWKVMTEGLAVGILTGFVGVGGGFLIVPALVLLGGISMRRAVGTSLVIIAAKSFTGLIKYLDVLETLQLSLDWQVIGTFVLIGSIGSIIGRFIGAHVPQTRLRQVFAVFLIAIGTAILAVNLPDTLA